MDDPTDVEIVESLYEAFKAKDKGRLNELIADDCEWTVGGDHGLSGTYEGKDAIWEYLRVMDGVLGGEFLYDLQTVAIDGEGVAVALMEANRGRDGDQRVVYVLNIRGGQVSKVWGAAAANKFDDLFWNDIALASHRPKK